MPSPRRPFPRTLTAGLLPLALAVGSLPLLAPTCGGGAEGMQTFSRGSLVIPMDRCYQFQTDGVTGTGQPAGCPQAADPGDVVKAYGLVYQLIRNDVAVYWVIDQAKTGVAADDLQIEYTGGAPAQLYDWTTGAAAGAPTAGTIVRYKGGPFVVDGSDYAKASAILQRYRTAFSTVNVHVANVAFRGYVKKTMAGGWSAGGAVPPKLALLDIGSGNVSSVTSGGSPAAINDPKNAEPVIEGYLVKAGIASAGAGGTATGPHGEIYDRLGIDDFQPATGSTDWRTSRFAQNGYQVLWVPHWVAPGSCSNFSSSANCLSTLYPEARIDQVLKTIGAFVAAGNDVFAECAGLGSFEGTFRRGRAGTAAGDYTLDYEDGDPATRFQTSLGVRYNELPDTNSSATGTQLPAARIPGSYGSPLLQIGDFPYSPYTGAVEDFRPQDGTTYRAGVQQLISAARSTASPEQKTAYGDSFDAWDYFTLLPSTEGRGSVVYLGGHSYSGVQGNFQIAGTRLVLNTLFNLGAGCTESGVSCSTLQLGVCAEGVITCSAGQPVCAQKKTASPEACNGLDDDCDGMVDEDLEVACYDGPAGTRDVGSCRAGGRSCVPGADGSYAMSACIGEVTPSTEVCNAQDDDCDGQIDEALTQECYYGPSSSLDPSGQPRGACRRGTQACVEGNFGECVGQVLPQPEEACLEGSSGGDLVDNDCNGVNDDRCACVDGARRPCYGGAAGTLGPGKPCAAGEQVCAGGAWSACVGEVLPQPEVCRNELDENCNGPTDDGPPSCATCRSGVDTEACYTGPAETRGQGVCADGTRACVNGDFAGACEGQVLPASGEPCDGLDNDCDGAVDDGAICASGFTCTSGLCVPAECGGESPCPEGFRCDGAGTCAVDPTGCGGTTCAPGRACRYGACVDPCEGIVCGDGAVCASGACVGGSCYFEGCGAGELCLDGACQPDPCGGVSCPSGTFCRQGDCVQACAFVTCRAGERCGPDGFCVEDACAGKICTLGDRCVEGACVPDPCAGKGCGQGQVCEEGVCVDDPCTGVVCPAGLCVQGQCYPSYNPTGAGSAPAPAAEAGGCGCGSAGATAFSALLGLLALPLARRRRTPRAGGPFAPLALVLAATALLATGCKEEEKPFDPTACANVCELEANRCVDFVRDPAHCGACGQACPAASVCVDGVCGPAETVAPHVTAVTPGQAPNGAPEPVLVELSGERFGAGATLRVAAPSGTRTYETELVAGKLRAEIDLEDAAPSTWQLRVVNPDRVISNAVRFDVFTPSPTLSALAPAQILAGATTQVVATGTGFAASSECHLAGTRFLEIAVPSTLLGPTSLGCAFDASVIPPGPYEVWIVNDGGLSSSRQPLSIVSATPVITAVSPSSGEAGAVIPLTVLGTGFDATSRVFLDGGELPTLFLDSTRLYVSQAALPACSGTCEKPVTVLNGMGGASAPVMFRVGALPPQVTGVTPGTGYQGDVVAVRFTGTTFSAASAVQAAPPAGVFTALPSSACGVGCVEGSLDLRGKPAGSWLVRLDFRDGSQSASYAFRVLSNQAILRDAQPRGGEQGSTKGVTLSVGNLRAPTGDVRVLFGAAPGPLTPSTVDATAGTVTVSVALSGLDTGTYTLAVVNPNGAAPSNAISFNVTPGQPTVTGVTPSSAPRRDEPVAIAITGSNFARPDASGNGGSVVHISAPTLGVVDYAVPVSATTVVSPTRIDVLLDTRSGLPGTYAVSVWNPGGPTPPQKATPLPGAFTIE